MDKPEFVYKTYISTTPERLWRALTEPAFTERYWKTSLHSDWKVGSTITWDNGGVKIEDPAQVVIEADPYRRLAYSWHTFTPELAELHGFSDELLAQVTSERRSKVTFDIETVGELVKLTVVHDGFEPGSAVVNMISDGWPRVLSDLKTMLEAPDQKAMS